MEGGGFKVEARWREADLTWRQVDLRWRERRFFEGGGAQEENQDGFRGGRRAVK